MKKLIFYDLDGTLADTRRDIARSVRHMLAEMKAPDLPPEEIRRHVGRGLYHLIGNCLKTNDLKQIEKGAKLYRIFYAEHMLDHTRLYPGALEILEFFRSRGCKQAVVTNKPNPFSKEMLDRLGVADYFADIVAGDSDHPRKPHPAAVLAVMKREKAEAPEALFVGDSLIDIETARNAGIEIAVVLHGFHTENELKSAFPDLIAKNFVELQKKIKKRGW